MMINYETYKTLTGVTYVQATLENGQVISIPNDLANADYQAYLATLVTESAPTA